MRTVRVRCGRTSRSKFATMGQEPPETSFDDAAAGLARLIELILDAPACRARLNELQVATKACEAAKASLAAERERHAQSLQELERQREALAERSAELRGREGVLAISGVCSRPKKRNARVLERS